MNKCKHAILLNNHDGTLKCANCYEIVTAYDINELSKMRKVELTGGDVCLHRYGGKLNMSKSNEVNFICNECGLEFPLLSRSHIVKSNYNILDENDLIQNIKLYNHKLTKDDIVRLFNMNIDKLVLELNVSFSIYENKICKELSDSDREKILEELFKI